MLPGTTQLINTTFGVTGDNTDNSPANTTCSTSSSNLNDTTAGTTVCPTDHTAAVGGAVGGVLGAALIGALVALFFALKGRKHYKSQLGSTSSAMAASGNQSAEEKAATQMGANDSRHQQAFDSPNYMSPVSMSETQ